MKRVVRSPEKASFVCHSAGGLVFRCYAEKLGGGFDRAALLGVPSGGSLMTDVKVLVDALSFVEGLKGGLPAALTETITEGKGAITPDLHPDSLFLRYLGRDRRLAKRYLVVYGRYLDGWKALGVRASVDLGKSLLKRVLREKVASPALRTWGLRLVDEVRARDEVLYGDLVVSVDSARLAGAGRTVATRLDHQALKVNEGVMREVTEFLFWSRDR
jgi:hypothetical protein